MTVEVEASLHSQTEPQAEPPSDTELLVKRLRRAAREPSRVFGATDTNKTQRPLWSFDVGGETWYGPYRGAWSFPGSDCSVLERAIERLGLEVLPLHYQSRGTQVIQRYLNAPARPVCIEPEPELVELPIPEWIKPHGNSLPKPTVLPGMWLAPGKLVPATPAFYILRRFAKDWEEVEWHLLDDAPVLRSVVKERPVGLVALTMPGVVEETVTPEEPVAA